MAKKIQPPQTPKPPASQTIKAADALEKMMSTIQEARAEADNEGNQVHAGAGNMDALRIMLASGPEDYLIDTYYMVCGFQSLRELDLTIIRADMLVERATRSFAESRAANPKVIDDLRQYGAIRQFAKAVTEPGEDARVWVAAKHLSEARNMVAHQLESPEIQKHLVDFFKAVGVTPTDTAADFEKAVLVLCGSIFTMKQNWIDRKTMNERIVRDFEEGKLTNRK